MKCRNQECEAEWDRIQESWIVKYGPMVLHGLKDQEFGEPDVPNEEVRAVVFSCPKCGERHRMYERDKKPWR